LDVLWQHRAASSSEGDSSTCNDNTVAALQDLEQQVQQLLQASGAIEVPSELGSSSTSNGTSGSMNSSWQSDSPSSSAAFLARDVSSAAAAAAAPQQQQGATQCGATPISLQEQQQQQQRKGRPLRLPLQHTISLPNNPQQQQQQQGDASGEAAGWCDDPVQDPLWLLKRGMAHLNLSAAVVASREERLVAWQHVQGQLSLLLRAIDDDAGGFTMAWQYGAGSVVLLTRSANIGTRCRLDALI
jgi:hypothetical protein